MAIPQVGDKIYIPWHGHGAEDCGGQAQVTSVEGPDAKGAVFITLAERPGYRYNWKFLEIQQEKLHEKYQEKLAIESSRA